MCPTVHAFLLTGSNAGSGAYVETNYTAVAPTPAGAPFWQVSGDWIYESQNSSPLYDPSGYFINGASYQLTENEGPLLQEGRFAFRLREGDVFGWYVDALDDFAGRAVAGFGAEITAIPLPAGGLLLLGGIAGLGAALRNRSRA